MNKFFKTLTAVAVVITLIACIGLLVACGDNSNDDSNEREYTYKFTVLDKHNAPASGIQVQLCVVDEDGNTNNCMLPARVDADGVACFYADGMPAVSAGVYEIHLLSEDGVRTLEFVGEHQTSVDQKDYSLKLA